MPLLLGPDFSIDAITLWSDGKVTKQVQSPFYDSDFCVAFKTLKQVGIDLSDNSDDSTSESDGCYDQDIFGNDKDPGFRQFLLADDNSDTD